MKKETINDLFAAVENRHRKETKRRAKFFNEFVASKNEEILQLKDHIANIPLSERMWKTKYEELEKEYLRLSRDFLSYKVSKKNDAKI